MSAPAVAVSNKHKKVVVAWKDVRKGEPNIYWSVSDKHSFTNENLVHDTLQGIQDHPSVTIDATGKAWIAWEDARDDKNTIRARCEGGSETVVSAGPNATFPVVASGAGIVAVVYESGKGREKSIIFRTLQRR